MSGDSLDPVIKILTEAHASYVWTVKFTALGLACIAFVLGSQCAKRDWLADADAREIRCIGKVPGVEVRCPWDRPGRMNER